MQFCNIQLACLLCKSEKSYTIVKRSATIVFFFFCIFLLFFSFTCSYHLNYYINNNNSAVMHYSCIINALFIITIIN